MSFIIQEFEVEGLKLISPFKSNDNRGKFVKLYEKEIYGELGLNKDINEVFVSTSKKGVIRGLHFQVYKPQVKYVSVLSGTVLDYAVDLRFGSTTFGKWERVVMSAEKAEILCIPEGFAHGFEVVSDNAIVSYICSGSYIKAYDTGIRYDDPKIGIEWKTTQPIISERDLSLMSLDEYIMKYKE